MTSEVKKNLLIGFGILFIVAVIFVASFAYGRIASKDDIIEEATDSGVCYKFSDIKKRDDKISDLTKLSNENKATIKDLEDTLSSTINQKQEELKMLNLQLTKEKEKTRELNAKIELCDKEKAKLELEIQDLQSKLDDLHTTHGEIQLELYTLKLKYESLKEEYAAAVKSLDEQTEKISNLDYTVMVLEDEIRVYKTSLTNANKRISDYESLETSLRSKIANIENSLAIADSATATCNGEKTQLQTELDTVNKSLDTCNANITGYRQAIGQYKQEISNLKIKNTDLVYDIYVYKSKLRGAEALTAEYKRQADQYLGDYRCCAFGQGCSS